MEDVQPQRASDEASNHLIWRSRTVEIGDGGADFADVGVLLRQARSIGGPHVVVSSVFGDVPVTLQQAMALSHVLARLVRDAGGVA